MTLRELLRLAIPSAAFTVLTNAFRVVDQYWIQDVSTAAQAAISASTFVIILFFASFQLLSAGAGPLIARAVGANDPEASRDILGVSLTGALTLSLFVALLGGLGARTITAGIGLTGDAANECVTYLQMLCWTMTPLVLTPLVDQAFVARGSAKIPTLMHGASLLLNIVLTPLFIYTFNWGIAGAALASNLSRGVTTMIGLWSLWRQMEMTPAHLKLHQTARALLARVVSIGAPIAAGVATYAGVYWGMLRTSISPLGPEVNAALGIGFSGLEGFTWPCFYGVSLAVASFIGRALGANNPDRAWATIKTALPISVALGILATAIFWWGASPLTALFTKDPVVHSLAIEYALILAFSQLAVSLEALAEGILSGAGATRTVLVLSLPFNLLRIPLAWAMALPLGMGAPGIWWAINISTFLKAIFKWLAVLQGRWLHLKP